MMEVSNQMLELYEQNRVPQCQGSEVEGSAGGASSHRVSKTQAASEEQASKQLSSRSATEHLHSENNRASSRNAHDDGSAEMISVINDRKAHAETKDNHHPEQLSHKENTTEVTNKLKHGSERIGEDRGRAGGRNHIVQAGEWKDDGSSCKATGISNQNLDIREGPVGQSPKEAIKMIDEDKVKAIREKRKKSHGEPRWRKDFIDEDDLIERELEDIEILAEDEKIKWEQRRSWSKAHENSDHSNDLGEVGDGNLWSMKGQSSRGFEAENTEEGEMVDDASPMLNSQKRKAGSPVDRQSEGRKHHEYMLSYNHDDVQDAHRMGRSSYADREYRRHAQENRL